MRISPLYERVFKKPVLAVGSHWLRHPLDGFRDDDVNLSAVLLEQARSVLSTPERQIIAAEGPMKRNAVVRVVLR
jgi:hypothetical protein